MLVRRYKRFLADVDVPGRGIVTMHCANTGAMTGCAVPRSRVWFSTSSRPTRKYAHTLEIVESQDGDNICVNTARANAIVAEALNQGRIRELGGSPVRREVAIPGERGRFDFAIGAAGACDETLVEVKCVTLCRHGRGEFPDAVSERAKRHVEALNRCVARGHRAVLLFCAPHSGIRSVTTADDIHPEYGVAVRRAVAAGVEVLAYGCVVTPRALAVERALPVVLD